jgi:DNA polymerase alpha subunit A
MELVQHTEGDAWLALGLATHLNVLPLSRELSCISGYLWSRTLQVTLDPEV